MPKLREDRKQDIEACIAILKSLKEWFTEEGAEEIASSLRKDRFLVAETEEGIVGGTWFKYAV